MSSTNLVEAFFYGLYMDPKILADLGVSARLPRLAQAKGYSLHLLDGKAKMNPEAGAVTWGITYELPPEDLKRLYSTESTRAYSPFKLAVTGDDGVERQVNCYNLPLDPQAPVDTAYLYKLLPVARKMGLPAEYLDSLESYANPTNHSL